MAGAIAFPVLAKEQQIDIGQKGHAVFISFSLLDKNPPIAAVDVGNTQMRRFTNPEACRVNRGENGSMFEIGSGVEQKLNLVWSQNRRKELSFLHAGHMKHVPIPKEDGLVVKFDGAIGGIT